MPATLVMAFPSPAISESRSRGRQTQLQPPLTPVPTSEFEVKTVIYCILGFQKRVGRMKVNDSEEDLPVLLFKCSARST
jgi:hypothetical protein